MGDRPTGDNQIIEYLLGALSADETERLDELSVADGEFADRVRIVENDLVDSYARGEMPSDLRTRFESNYLTTPMRRERISFARSLAVALDRVPPVDKETVHKKPQASKIQPAPTKRGLGAWLQIAPRLSWGLAAAIVVLLVASVWLVSERGRLVNQSRETSAVYEALRNRERELLEQLDRQRSADVEKQKELDEIRDKLAQLELRGREPDSSAAKPNLIGFTLAPQTRGVNDVPLVTLPAEPSHLNLRLELERGDFASYSANLKSLTDNRSVWASGSLRARGKGDSKALNVMIRSSLLKDQRYMLEVTGFGSDGSREVCGTYLFRIAREK
ncbi:MAG TPA: hypothetical protein VFV34_20880 [Blastocatellia bacterium]|nr:hypothetical protein [Blastocatellia bacterium]